MTVVLKTTDVKSRENSGLMLFITNSTWFGGTWAEVPKE